jgi:hypothetical protein
MATNDDQPRQPESIDRRRLITSTIVTLLILVLCLFVPAGTLVWFRGWLFLFVMLGTAIPVTMYLRRVNPDVIAGRVNRHERPRRWDLLVGVIFILPTRLQGLRRASPIPAGAWGLVMEPFHSSTQSRARRHRNGPIDAGADCT